MSFSSALLMRSLNARSGNSANFNNISKFNFNETTANLAQIVKPSLEGFGEVSIPFYSDSFMYYVNPSSSYSVKENVNNMQLPFTGLTVVPQGDFNSLSIYRNAMSDFEFSYLIGTPLITDLG